MNGWRLLSRLLSSRVRDLEENLGVASRAAEQNMNRWSAALGEVSRLTAERDGLQKQVEGLNDESRDRFREVQKLRGEVATHVAALDRCRQVSDGRAADLVEARRELERLRPKGADPITTPRSDADEVTRLTGELERTKRALSAAHDRLAEYRDREVVGDGRTG